MLCLGRRGLWLADCCMPQRVRMFLEGLVRQSGDPISRWRPLSAAWFSAKVKKWDPKRRPLDCGSEGWGFEFFWACQRCPSRQGLRHVATDGPYDVWEPFWEPFFTLRSQSRHCERSRAS